MSTGTILLDKNNFKTAISCKIPTLVDFWTPWCGPCKAIAPILEELSAELVGKITIGKVNIDENSELASQFGVRAIPTLLLFKNGEVVGQYIGMIDKATLKLKLTSNI